MENNTYFIVSCYIYNTCDFCMRYVCVVVKNLSFFFVSKSFLVFDTMVIAPTIIKEVKKISTKEKFESTDM